MNDLDDLLTPKISKRQRQTRTLTIDLERLPGIARVWSAKVDYIRPDQWVRWPSTICFAAKWLGDKRTIFRSVWADGHKGMTQAAWDLYHEADHVITYNGAAFDNKIFRQDWLAAGLSAPSPWRDIDLLKEVRRAFGFESNSLQSVLTRLGMQAKSGHYSISDAEACVAGDTVAQQRMETYCSGDVAITERLYLRLKSDGYLPGHPVVGDAVSEGQLFCPTCGSKKIKREGWYRATVQEYARYRCSACNSYFRSTLVRGVSNTRPIR